MEGIPVPEDAFPLANERIDLDYTDDQLADESQYSQNIFAEDRDGGGHSHDHSHSHENQHSIPESANDSYESPHGGDTYSAPQAPAAADSYGAPQSEPVDEYGAPQAPPQTQYLPAPQASGPIPVPLPLPVRPGSIVIPVGPKPAYNRPPPNKPQHPVQYQNPPPKPYRPPQPQYKPRPRPNPAPQQQKQPYKPRPPPPKKTQYKPKPTYAPPKPTYNPQPPKPSYQPQPPLKNPQPKPPKQPYSPEPKPQHIAPSYSQPSKPDDLWPQAQPDMPKITNLDVQCEKNLMKVSIKFDKPFYGIIFSKGFYSDVNCVHLPAGVGRSDAQFDIAINSCGTTGNTGKKNNFCFI